MWDFQRINGIVKDQIRSRLWNEIPCADKIQLAHQYEITDWYADAYYDLAIRTEPLSVEDGGKLGLEFSIKMSQVRERVVAAVIQLQKELVARRAVDQVFFSTNTGSEEQSLGPGDKQVDDETDREEAPAQPVTSISQGFSFGHAYNSLAQQPSAFNGGWVGLPSQSSAPPKPIRKGRKNR